MGKAAGFLHKKIGLKAKDETSKMLHSDQNFERCLNLDTLDGRSEIAGEFWYVVLEKDGEDQMDWSWEKWRSIAYSRGGKEYPTNNKHKED